MTEVASKDILNYEGLYWINSNGLVQSVTKGGFPHGELKPSLNNSGYLYVGLYNNGKRKNKMIHRLVATHFINNPNGYKFVNHKNGIKTDNSLSNLEWCSSSDNSIHAFRTGLRKPPMTKGESIGLSKLTDLTVKAIRGRYASGSTSYRELSYEYGVAKSTIERVVNRKTWRHL